jgi:hypothetical protein
MQRFRKISALFLSLLVLFGSTSFTINMHLCMEQIESISLIKDATDCEMRAKASSCPMGDHQQQEDHEDSKGCCEDRTHLIEGQDEFKEVRTLSLPNIQFVSVLYAVVFNFLSTSIFENFPYKEYSPPLIERDIPVLVQSFLI